MPHYNGNLDINICNSKQSDKKMLVLSYFTRTCIFIVINQDIFSRIFFYFVVVQCLTYPFFDIFECRLRISIMATNLCRLAKLIILIRIEYLILSIGIINYESRRY
jgi:hypothetical protein